MRACARSCRLPPRALFFFLSVISAELCCTDAEHAVLSTRKRGWTTEILRLRKRPWEHGGQRDVERIKMSSQYGGRRSFKINNKIKKNVSSTDEKRRRQERTPFGEIELIKKNKRKHEITNRRAGQLGPISFAGGEVSRAFPAAAKVVRERGRRGQGRRPVE